MGLMGPGAQALCLWSLNECFRSTPGGGTEHPSLSHSGTRAVWKAEVKFNSWKKDQEQFTAVALMLGICPGYLLLCDKLSQNVLFLNKNHFIISHVSLGQ